MVPMYCFEGLSRESGYKTEREEAIHDEQVGRRRVDSGCRGIGHSPVSLLCDAFCAVVWVNSCVVQHLLVVLGLGASVSGAFKNPWQQIKSMKQMSSWERWSFFIVTETSATWTRRSFLHPLVALLLWHHLLSSSYRFFFLVIIMMKKTPTLREKSCLVASAWVLSYAQCGQDYALTFSSVFIKRK